MRDLDLNDPRVLTDSLVVSASAGSGKTFTLTVLVTATLGREDARAHEILATTFSEDAAADLRERLLRPLDLLATLDAAAWAALLPPLAERDGAAVAALLRGLPLPAGLLKPALELAQASVHWQGAAWTASPARARAFWRKTRREAELLQVATIHSLALGLLRQGEGAPEAILDSAHPALLRVLRQALREATALPAGHPDQAPARVLRAWAEKHWEALSRGHDGHRDAMGELAPQDLAPLRDRLQRALAAAEAAFAPYAADPDRACDPTSRTRRNFKAGMLLAIPGPGAELIRRIRWAENQSLAISLDEDLAPRGYYAAEFHAACASLEPVADAWEAWLRGLMVEALRAFELRKAAQGQATFGDMVRRALEALRRGEVEPPRPRLLLVDEYQDTSRAQDAFLEALEPARTVRVGDLKQAIYGFRGGDPDLLRAKLAAAGELAFRLPSNFRSAPAVVALANRYVDEVWPRLDPGAGDLDGNQLAVSTCGLQVGIHRSAAPANGIDMRALAGWISALALAPGWDGPLGRPEGPGARRRALLLRQRTRLPELLLALKRQGIQPYVVAREGFWESPGIRVVMAALEAVAHPERELPAAVLLRHLAGFGDAELAALAQREDGRRGLPGLGGLDPARCPEPLRPAVAWLLELRGCGTQELAGRLLAHGALAGLLEALAAHGAMEPLRARRNLAAFLARLLDLPASPFAAFALLEEERAGLERGDLPASAEGADLIIQTVHGSKGLEYHDVILPLLNARPSPLRHGDVKTLPGQKDLLLAWKLGQHPGAAYRALKPLVADRQRKDDLNLLYVGCTRAQERMVLMLQAPAGAAAPEAARTWAQMGLPLAAAHPGLVELPAEPPPLAVPSAAPVPALLAPPVRTPLAAPAAPAGGAHHAQARGRQEGEAMHAFLRDLLVRWEAPAAFQACLAGAPGVARARDNALRFLEQFEARGWRHLRRRTELPVAGAAASGAEGRADLVVWDGDRIHLLDFKHSRDFGAEDLAGYGAQLRRYADALAARHGLPVDAWLVALKSGDWVEVPVA